eukprot:2883340-Pyramimonas_sp.AAC.1
MCIRDSSRLARQCRSQKSPASGWPYRASRKRHTGFVYVAQDDGCLHSGKVTHASTGSMQQSPYSRACAQEPGASLR